MSNEEKYTKIFKQRDYSSFLQCPTDLPAYMMDFGIDGPTVSAVRLLITASKRHFVEAISSKDAGHSMECAKYLSEKSGMSMDATCAILTSEWLLD